jgi:hypothetical protein
VEIVATTFVANLPGGGAQAWRATIERTAEEDRNR